MRYPDYPSQPFTGNLLTGKQGGPPDARFTSGTSPYYQSAIDRNYGRALAGDNEVEQPNNAWAVSELEAMRELDDVQGDGIFDPPGTHPNVHADAGSLAARYALPGYHVREVPFKFSEVRDATTGRPIMPVPNGAVALDTPVKLAMLERNLYAPAQPIVWSNRGGQVTDRSIANVVQNPEPVSMGRWLGDDVPPVPPNNGRTVLAVIGVGLAAGALYALFTK